VGGFGFAQLIVSHLLIVCDVALIFFALPVSSVVIVLLTLRALFKFFMLLDALRPQPGT